MSSSETVSVRLIFPPVFKRQFEKLSRDIAAAAVSQFVLGEQIPAHVTLLSFHYDGQPMRLDRLQGAVTTVGLCLLSASGEQGWIGARVRKSRKLVALRQELWAACGAPPLLREEFLPHVTLGLISKGVFEDVARTIQDENMLRLEDIPCMAEGVIYSPEKGYRSFSG